MNWIALFLTVVSQIFIIKKNRMGFLVSGVGNICWIIAISDVPLILVNLVFIGINVTGFLRWRKE